MDEIIYLLEREMPTEKIGRLGMIKKLYDILKVDISVLNYIKENVDILMEVGYIIHDNYNDCHINKHCIGSVNRKDVMYAYRNKLKVIDVIRKNKLTKLLLKIRTNEHFKKTYK